MPELASCTFQIACDVTNPLVGAQGCSAVFAPQKGADAKMVQAMDAAMNRYADIVEDMYRKNPTLMENQLTGYDEADKNVEKTTGRVKSKPHDTRCRCGWWIRVCVSDVLTCSLKAGH